MKFRVNIAIDVEAESEDKASDFALKLVGSGEADYLATKDHPDLPEIEEELIDYMVRSVEWRRTGELFNIPAEEVYAHLWHVDGQLGGVDYELILGPFEGVQLTYNNLRETENGDSIATYDKGYWYPLNAENPAPYSDVTFSEDRPQSVVG